MSVPVPAVARLRVAPLQTALTGGKTTRGETLRRLARNRSAVLGGSVLMVIVLLALAASIVSPYDPIKTNQRLSLEAPSAAHLMVQSRAPMKVAHTLPFSQSASLLHGRRGGSRSN